MVEIGTATGTQDRSINSSIKPKCDNWFFVDLYTTRCKLFLFWFVELEEQFQVHKLYKKCKLTKKFGLIKEIVNLSCTHLTVKNCIDFKHWHLIFYRFRRPKDFIIFGEKLVNPATVWSWGEENFENNLHLLTAYGNLKQ